MVLLSFFGVSNHAISRWSAFVFVGVYSGLGLVDAKAEKLSKYWAGFWLPFLFLTLESGREFAIAALQTGPK